MKTLKLIAGKVLFKNAVGQVTHTEEPCRKCCCVPDPENEGQSIYNYDINNEAACVNAGGEWGACPIVCNPCDCRCDYNDGLAISGSGPYAFYFFPSIYGGFFPFNGLPTPPFAVGCTTFSPGWFSQYRYSDGGPGENPYYEATVAIQITADCCNETLTIAAAVSVNYIEQLINRGTCGTVLAIVTVHHSSSPCSRACESRQTLTTITEEWVPEPDGPPCPYTTLGELRGAGIYLDDILNPLPVLNCPRVPCATPS
jgi:hypothetical protein